MNDTDFTSAMQRGLQPLPAPDTIQRGNEGIDLGEWTGWNGPSESPAQVYPQPSDMPDLREWLDRDASRCAARDVGFLAVGLLAGLLLGMTF